MASSSAGPPPEKDLAPSDDGERFSLRFYVYRFSAVVGMGAIGGVVDLLRRCFAPISAVSSVSERELDVWYSVLSNFVPFALFGGCAGLFVVLLLAGKELHSRKTKFFYSLTLSLAGGVFWYPVFQALPNVIPGMQQPKLEKVLNTIDEQIAGGGSALSEEQVDQVDKSARELALGIPAVMVPGIDPITKSEFVRKVGSTYDKLNIAFDKLESQASDSPSGELAEKLKTLDESIGRIDNSVEATADPLLIQSTEGSKSRLVPRVYIQSPENFVKSGEKVMEALRAKGFSAPGVERVGGEFEGRVPEISETRYFYPEDEGDATSVQEIVVSALGVDSSSMRLVYSERYRGTSRPGHIEVWLGRNVPVEAPQSGPDGVAQSPEASPPVAPGQ